MDVGGVGGSSGAGIVDSSQTGFAALTSEDFMKLLITQLQNQDPTEPVGNEELVNQLSQMRNLQSNIELGDALKAVTNNQQLSTAANLIGRQIEGTGSEQQTIEGIVTRAFLRDGTAYVAVGNEELPLANVLSVEQAA